MSTQSPRSEYFFDFGDEAGEASWLMWHHMRHQTYDRIMATSGNKLPTLDLSMKVDGDWRHRHAVRHSTLRKFAGTVTRNSIAGLRTVDWHDAKQQQDWLRLHAIDHQNLDAFFGLT